MRSSDTSADNHGVDIRRSMQGRHRASLLHWTFFTKQSSWSKSCVPATPRLTRCIDGVDQTIALAVDSQAWGAHRTQASSSIRRNLHLTAHDRRCRNAEPHGTHACGR